MGDRVRLKAEYRSSIRSKTLIRNALVSLMQEKPFEKISITDVVKRADINRGTFYAHYRDTKEVLEKMRDEALEKLQTAFSRFTPDSVICNPRQLFDAISDFVREDLEFYRMVLSIDGVLNMVIEEKNKAIEYLMSSSVISSLRSEHRRLALSMVSFCVSGTIDTYYDAVMGNIPLALSEVSPFLTDMVARLVAPYIASVSTSSRACRES